MLTLKEKTSKKFRFEDFVKSAAVAAVLGTTGLLPCVANAQSAMPDSSATPVPAMSVTIPNTSDDSAIWPEGINYAILGDTHYSYNEIMRARAHGLSNYEVGKAIEIAKRADIPTDQVINWVEEGWSFVTIEDHVGVWTTLPDEDYAANVHDYIEAYKHTGNGALKMASESEINSTYAAPMNGTGSMNGGMPYNPSSTNAMSGDILQTAAANGNFHTFLKLVHRAGLDSALSGPGPLTVFAPTDAAFAKLDSGEMRKLWKNRSELKTVLEYHVIPARIDAATAMAMTSPTSPATLEGDTLQVTTVSGNVMINNAEVVTPDIQASNGIIHAVDTVLVPASLQLTWGNNTPSYGLGADTGAGAHNGSGGYNNASGAYNGAGANAVTPNTTPGSGIYNGNSSNNGTGSMSTTPGSNDNGTGMNNGGSQTPSSSGMNNNPNSLNNETTPSMPGATNSTIQVAPVTPNNGSDNNSATTPGTTDNGNATGTTTTPGAMSTTPGMSDNGTNSTQIGNTNSGTNSGSTTGSTPSTSSGTSGPAGAGATGSAGAGSGAAAGSGAGQ